MARPKALRARCGTRSGYNRHRLDGEPACDECKRAVAAWHRQYQARRGQYRGAPWPPPATFARCQRGCGRLVWDFDAGLCGACCESEAA